MEFVRLSEGGDPRVLTAWHLQGGSWGTTGTWGGRPVENPLQDKSHCPKQECQVIPSVNGLCGHLYENGNDDIFDGGDSGPLRAGHKGDRTSVRISDIP